MGIEPFLVGSALDCVLAQRLARRLCMSCREEYKPTPETLAAARFLGPGRSAAGAVSLERVRQVRPYGISGRVSARGDAGQRDLGADGGGARDHGRDHLAARAEGMHVAAAGRHGQGAGRVTSLDEVLRVVL